MFDYETSEMPLNNISREDDIRKALAAVTLLYGDARFECVRWVLMKAKHELQYRLPKTLETIEAEILDRMEERLEDPEI